VVLIAWLLLILLTAIGVATAHAMNTKDAGQCVALGALSDSYAAKAQAVLATAKAQGYAALVEQRVREEFAWLKRHERDRAAKEGWMLAAVRACEQF
jgi:hypothetical protein